MQASGDCRYCPNPARVVAVSGAMSLHGFAFLLLLIPITAIQIPGPKPRVAERDRLEVTIVPEVVVPETPPPPQHHPQVAHQAVVPVVPTVPVSALPVPMPEPVSPFVAPEATPAGETIGETAPAGATQTIDWLIKPDVRYPMSRLRQGIEGVVLLRVLVDREGVPSEIRIQRSSGDRELDRAAKESVRSARMRPSVVNGEPQEVWATVPISFSLLNG